MTFPHQLAARITLYAQRKKTHVGCRMSVTTRGVETQIRYQLQRYIHSWTRPYANLIVYNNSAAQSIYKLFKPNSFEYEKNQRQKNMTII